ncbi:amidase [Profundibacter sp.]|uniref:amidase n=1 Tax=Profundibacter sp. TaxID=3101071 RepID=UPI003D0B2B51
MIRSNQAGQAKNRPPRREEGENGNLQRFPVEDVALFLDAMAGQDMRDPLSVPAPKISYLTAAQSRMKPLKVAFSADLGITPVDSEIAEICQSAAQRFVELGVAVEEASPDFSGVHECYHTLRAHEFSLSMNDMPDGIMAQLKPELAENLEIGRRQSFKDIAKATKTRAVIRKRILEFFETYDLLLVPTTIVGPYPVEQRFVTSCNGQTFKSYIDWLAIAYAITLVSLPTLSLPCGFTRDGLPVGLQMVGRPRGEHALLSSALVLEEALGLDLRPIEPKPASVPTEGIPA